MTTAGAAGTVAESPLGGDGDPGAERVVVYNCSRIGLRANPPGFSLLDLFRPRRRRR